MVSLRSYLSLSNCGTLLNTVNKTGKKTKIDLHFLNSNKFIRDNLKYDTQWSVPKEKIFK